MSQRIVPMLVYEDAPRVIEFLCEAFGFEEQMRFDMPDGRVGHAEVGRDGNIVMLSSEFPEMGLTSPKRLASLHAQVHCTVDDVDAHYECAKAAGAVVAAAPEDQDHGHRNYRAVDPEGGRWMFSMPIAPE